MQSGESRFAKQPSSLCKRLLVGVSGADRRAVRSDSTDTLTNPAETVVDRARGFNWAGFIGGGPLFVAGLAGFGFNRGIHDRGVYIAGTAAVFVLLVVYALVMSPRMKQETLTVDGNLLIYKGAWRTRTVDVNRGRAVNLAYKFSPGATYRRWLFLSESGTVSLRLPIEAWSAKDLASIATSLGLAIEVIQDPMKPRRARRIYPGSWSWAGAHPAMCFLLFCVVATVVIAIAVGPAPRH